MFQSSFNVVKKRNLYDINVWKVARTDIDTFRFRKLFQKSNSHAYENETNAQNDKFEFPWRSSAWIHEYLQVV